MKAIELRTHTDELGRTMKAAFANTTLFLYNINK